MRHRRNIPSRSNRSRAFTLVEVLLALALTSIVVGAIYTAFNMYQRLSTAGRDQVERSQIARAIHRKMAVDIRSVLYKPPEEQENEDTDEDLSEEEMALEDQTTKIEVTDPTESIVAAKGIVGGPNSLVLYVSRPPRNLAYTPVDQPRTVNSRSSDLISVTYLLASPDNGGLQSTVAEYTKSSGLARLEGDRLVMDQLDASGDKQALASTARILAPEVTSLQFSYYGDTGQGLGLQWYETWDTTVTKKLPRAIGVKLEILVGPAGSEKKPVACEFVIFVPASDPKPPEEELGF